MPKIVASVFFQRKYFAIKRHLFPRLSDPKITVKTNYLQPDDTGKFTSNHEIKIFLRK